MTSEGICPEGVQLCSVKTFKRHSSCYLNQLANVVMYEQKTVVNTALASRCTLSQHITLNC